MGYIRMMRSGGIHCCSNASVYLAIADEELGLDDLGGKDITKNSAENLVNEVAHLHHNYAESTTEYFHVSVM